MVVVTIDVLDAGNPLFLQNNDHSNVLLIGFKLTSTENYKMWSTAMKIALTGKNKFGFVNGTCVKPVTSHVLAQQWKRCNAIVLGWILSSFSPELYLGQVYSQIASKVWDGLEETYDKRDGSVIFNVINKIHALKQGASSSYRSTSFDTQFMKDQMMKILSLINDKPSGNVSANMAGIGSEATCLYLFDVEQCGKSVVGLANSTFMCHASKQLWHSRLGHPSDHVLSVLSSKFGLKYDKHVSPCDICHQAKQTREPFPLSDHKSLFVGDLVHLDLWGPIRCNRTPKVPSDDEREHSIGDGNKSASQDINSPHPIEENATFTTPLNENINVNNAFLYGDLHKDVYMDLPPGYYDSSETKVCKLVKSLYGLKQAPRQWNEKLTSVLNENGFVQSVNDYYLFVKHDNNLILVLLVYVDDIVVTGYAFTSEVSSFSWFKGVEAAMSRSSAEAEYRCLASTIYEVLWIINLVKDLDVEGMLLVPLYCDSSSAIQIAANPVFHEKTKHFEIDMHLVREKVASGAISTVKIDSARKVADVFTKGSSIFQHKQFCLHLNLVDMFSV
nr:putative Gag-polypeptide of LTR copia-type [Tanacetum cinerariifolium]